MEIIQRLTEVGFPPASTSTNDLIAAVRAFQAATPPLKVDGILGPKTRAALARPPKVKKLGYCVPGWKIDEDGVPLALRPVIAVARLDIGIAEDPTGSNRGQRIDAMLAAANPDALCAKRIEGRPCTVCNGYPGPQPGCTGCAWCAAALSDWFSALPGGSPFGRKLSTRAIRAWAIEHGRVVQLADARPGDAFFIPTTPYGGHVGLIVDARADAALATIEGNSGDACWGRLRARSTIPTIIRPV